MSKHEYNTIYDLPGEDDCTPATCTNGKCNATGECIEATRPGLRRAPDYDAIHKDVVARFPETLAYLAATESPPIAPTHIVLADRFTISGKPSGACWKIDADGHRVPTRTIVAFTGLAGSGKSTAAAHLVNRHGYQRVRFAGPLKSMMAALGCTPAEIDGDRKEVPCELLGGKTPRYAMQTIGTEWGRDLIASDLWIRAWYAALAKVPACVPVVVDDCRFPNECAAVTAAGGVIVRIERPGAGTASIHASEQHVLPAAETLRNIADERYLLDQVDILVMDLSWREHAPMAAAG